MTYIGPKLLPSGSVDTHFHIFGPAPLYPYAIGRSYTPCDAGLDAYLAMAADLGIARAVMVQPSPYGTDNRRLLDGMTTSPIPMRGVVSVDADISDADLAEMHQAGVRAIRINLVFDASAAIQTAILMAPRMREIGWHIQFLVDVSTWPDVLQTVRSLGVPAVFDHLGHVPARKGTGDAGFQALLSLLRDGAAWVKASGIYRMTGQTAPHDDVRKFFDAAIEANPDRVIWATDWPHTAIKVPMPDDATLVATTMKWLGGDVDLQEAIFVRNPVALYGFS